MIEENGKPVIGAQLSRHLGLDEKTGYRLKNA
jgi:hypothetical protein